MSRIFASLRSLCPLVLAVSLHSGCRFDLSGIPVSEPRDAALRGDASSSPRPDAGVDAAQNGAPQDPSMMRADARTEDLNSDAMSAGVQHPACRQRFPKVTPEVGQIVQDAHGRPAFDFWRDLPCDPPSAPVGCAPDLAISSPWGCKGCLAAASGARGVCNAGPIAERACADMKGFNVPLSYQDGGCASCVPPALKRHLCCQGTQGVDCRPWPFEVLSGTGEICSRHEDCEQGLVCRAPEGFGYGLCECPGGASPVPTNAASCEGTP